MLWASNMPPQTPLHSQEAEIAAFSSLEDSEKTSSHLRATQTLCDLTLVIVCVLFLTQRTVSIITGSYWGKPVREFRHVLEISGGFGTSGGLEAVLGMILGASGSRFSVFLGADMAL